MSRLVPSALVAIGLVITATSAYAVGQTFRGTLDRNLKVDSRAGSFLHWSPASPGLAKTLGLNPDDLTGLYQGQLSLGSKPVLQFGAAIAELRDGTKLFFVDRQTGSGALEHVESWKFGAPSQSYYSAEVNFDVQLQDGPFRSVPVYIALPKGTGGYPLKPGQLAVVAGDRPYVGGSVTLPGRRLLVRYAYDLDSSSVRLDKAVEWFDVNGDGTVDLTAGSPERGVPEKTAPIFNVGKIALQTESINLATHSVVLKQVLPDMKRISLIPGSRVPDFTYRDFSGRERKLSDVKSKYTLLDFWATWCVPCVADLPSKREAYRRFHQKGFEILGMNGDADKDKPEALLKKLEITWPEAKSDPELLLERFKITTWPTLILIDEAGNIVSTDRPEDPPLSGADLQATLQRLLD